MINAVKKNNKVLLDRMIRGECMRPLSQRMSRMEVTLNEGTEQGAAHTRRPETRLFAELRAGSSGGGHRSLGSSE